MTREEKRYAVIFRSLLPVFSVLLRKYSFRTDRVPQMDEPFLMLANHATESDHFMAACAAQTPMTFVCGEHLLRGKYGKLLKNIADPIPVPKGASAVLAVKEILRRLRRGENVMLFPEGSRSFHGETLPMTNAIGKLVKMGRSALVTYRIQGGYFVAPRWAYHFRKGPMEGRVVNVYSSEQLKGMTAAQITEAINRDLYENAYETQRRHPQRYLAAVSPRGWRITSSAVRAAAATTRSRARTTASAAGSAASRASMTNTACCWEKTSRFARSTTGANGSKPDSTPTWPSARPGSCSSPTRLCVSMRSTRRITARSTAPSAI